MASSDKLCPTCKRSRAGREIALPQLTMPELHWLDVAIVRVMQRYAPNAIADMARDFGLDAHEIAHLLASDDMRRRRENGHAKIKMTRAGVAIANAGTARDKNLAPSPPEAPAHPLLGSDRDDASTSTTPATSRARRGLRMQDVRPAEETRVKLS